MVVLSTILLGVLKRHLYHPTAEVHFAVVKIGPISILGLGRAQEQLSSDPKWQFRD